MNVKQDFLKWFFQRDTYKQVPETSIKRFIDEYSEWLNFDPFELNDDLSNIEDIKQKIISRSDELKDNNPEYVAFQLRSSRNAPAAILGKNNYFLFLDELKIQNKTGMLDLSSILKKPDILSIIQEPEFYFQKGQDALKKWIDFDVSDELTEKLIKLSKDYGAFQEEAIKHLEIKQVLELFFEIIAYCDSNAKDKHTYNQYKDKRVLALAFVRMNNWIEKLIQFKFLPDEVGTGSPQNAFDYLLDPINNSTVLSENHRKQISENLIGKPYKPDEFVTDLETFFSGYNLKTLNPQNYSHLLMKIVYSFENEWRKEETDKISSQFSKNIEQLKNLLENDQNTKGLFVFEKPTKTYVWIKDSLGLIGDMVCHYEISYNKAPSLYTVDVHFEGTNLSDYQQFDSVLKNLPDELKRFPWRKKGDSIRYGNGISSVHPDLVDELKTQLCYIEENIGDKIREIIKSSKSNQKGQIMEQKTPLNQILFGPPGTGKTFNTVNKAIAIAHPDFNLNQTRDVIKLEFDKLINEGQIVFTTFHQSMSYEDFIEGIKPVLINETVETDPMESGKVAYEIQDGLFKKLCKRAQGVSAGIKSVKREIDFDRASYFKMSIGGKTKPHIHEWCIINNKLALGWGNDMDFSTYLDLVHAGNWNKFRDRFIAEHKTLVDESRYHIQAMYIFLKMKKGDVVLVSKGNQIIDAVGVIKNDKYIFDDSQDFDYYQFREVEWIATNLDSSPELFVKKNISQQSIYEFYSTDINKEYFKKFFATSENITNNENFVLIIDEINRGNVSQIFGELITLIEEDKRNGKGESLKVTLPYSKKPFGVPANLYIIGTMNTADRSVEALDTALRRRFSFEEIPPRYDLPELNYEYAGFKGFEILQTLNKRIEKLLDKDHQIGHSYLMPAKDEKSEEKLLTSFYKNIIPLLQEYFFGDFGKIGLVLGKGFVKVNDWDKNADSFADFDYQSASEFDDREVFKIIDYRQKNLDYSIQTKDKLVKMDFQKAIKLLMNQTIE